LRTGFLALHLCGFKVLFLFGELNKATMAAQASNLKILLAPNPSILGPGFGVKI
jgi:hypothetical protein